MPLYDFVVMVKPAVDRRNLVEFMTRVGQRVYARSGVVTNIKSFGRVNLAYDIKKRDGRFSEVNPVIEEPETLKPFSRFIQSFLCSCFEGAALGLFIARASNPPLIAYWIVIFSCC
jgi:ribosomal protein S6